MMNKQKLKGIRYILFAAFFFASMNLFVKMAGNLPVWQKCFFRNLVAGFIAIGMLIKKKERIVIPKGNWLPLALRCIGGTLGILCNFYAIGQMNIADASMLNKLSPFFCIILSIFVLKEKPNRKEVIAVILAFTGALFVVKPSFQMECIPALFGVLGGLGAGDAAAGELLGVLFEGGIDIVARPQGKQGADQHQPKTGTAVAVTGGVVVIGHRFLLIPWAPWPHGARR